MVCPSALDSKPLSCRDDFFATALKDLVGWFGNHKSFPPSKEGKRFRSTGRTCRPRMHQRVRHPKNVEVPKFSSTDTQTKTKAADLCSVVFAFTIHNGHLRFIYPPFQTTHRFRYPSLSPSGRETTQLSHEDHVVAWCCGGGEHEHARVVGRNALGHESPIMNAQVRMNLRF